MEFIESGLKFVFDEKQWDIITQFDSETDYKKVKNNLEGTKSIDFLGTTDDKIYFFEMKRIPWISRPKISIKKDWLTMLKT